MKLLVWCISYELKIKDVEQLNAEMEPVFSVSDTFPTLIQGQPASASKRCDFKRTCETERTTYRFRKHTGAEVHVVR